MGFHGNRFTWTNKRSGAARVNVRLDRALGNSNWATTIDTSVSHLARGRSDHCPALVKIQIGKSNTTSRFKFLNACQIVEYCWALNRADDPIVNFHLKLKNLKDHLKVWNK